MSQKQWGLGFYNGKNEILRQLGVPNNLIERIKKLEPSSHDSFDCDKAEIELQLQNIDLLDILNGL